VTQPSAPVPYTDDDDIPLFAPTPKVYPQKVSGTYRRIKWGLLIVGMAIYYLLPFVRWDRGPNLPDQAVLVDFERRRFYFFFIELWPQEVYYFTGLLILAAIILFLMNALAGRIWCGYLCPQTVWTDLFLRVERFFEGDRRDRIKLDDAPWTAEKVARKAGKHFVWLMIAWWTGGAWVLYFADAPTLVRDLATLQAPFTAYLWIGILTTTTYILAGHLREQVCLHMCPWPRIQAALTDEHALNVSYRYDRGEPRMSVKDARRAREAEQPAGDCIDCHQCVAVCPTGVDIRQGSQLGCIQCGLCIDACDTVMTKIGRPTRLIAYDTDEAIRAREVGQTPTYKPVRARTILYAAIIALVGGAMIYQLATRAFLGMSLIHDRTPLFVTLRDGSIRNAYTVRLINKRSESRQVALTIDGPTSVSMEVQGATATSDCGTNMIRIKASDLFAGETVTIAENFFAP
jgi:cytochrome c oxidase accessory protein FixG